MTIYDNDLPPGVTKDSFLVNPYGSKHDGNMFHDPGLNKAYNHSSQGGSLGGSPTCTGRASPSAGYGYAPAGKPWPRWATAIILILFAFAILAYARYTMVVKRLAPYPQSEHVLLVGENLGVNPTGKSVADKYKAQLNLFKDQMAPLFPENASWENFYSGCGATLRCITHPIEVVERFRKNALAPDTFWNDLCNLTNYHRDDFPASVPLQWIIKTKVQNAGSYSPTTFSQCELSANSLREVNNYVTASRARWLLVGNMIFGVMFLVVLMGGWVWYSGGFPKWIRVGKSKNRVGASYMAKIAAYPRLEKWSAGDLRMVCGDRFFMAEAIRKFPGNYQYGSPEVREDVELARSAIVGSFLNIRYAPDSIKSNPDLVILACGNGSWSELKNASEKLRGDPDFMLRVLEYSQNGSLLEYATPALLTNETFLRNALKINSFILKYCTNALRDDYDAVKSIVSIEACGGELEYASKRLLEKKDLVLLAYQNAGDFTSIYEKLSAALKRDVEVIEAAKKARDCHFSLA